MSNKCNGNYECFGKEDENRSTCPNHIRSGDLVGLQSRCKRGLWLSRDGVDKEYCRMKTCPGEGIEEKVGCEWEKFYIVGVGLQEGSLIKDAAKIAFYRRSFGWLSCGCNFQWCYTKLCLGAYKNVSLSTQCHSEVFYIFMTHSKKVVLKNDLYVNIRATKCHEWISEYHGDYVRSQEYEGSCEIWQIQKV